ncbi:uncharacterized protein LOC108600703 [Drosophila busckii]|uniref:uncharacterized protein LOC108600703 n=1 Tax=Drosophila busckii TaxID=30019 RepID=UPI001432F11A|nr:uncharacterized protein LOC108600703 [Drosophila busckii]
MAEVPKITDFHKVVEPHLHGATLESYESSYLTKPGDNYGSIMLSIKAKIKQPNGNKEELPLIAKLPPLTNDLYWQLFHPERTCITENTVYKNLGPELDKLQLEAGVLPTKLFDGFSRYYGSRISLNENSTVVDRDALLVQENLTVRGYKPGNRHDSYDLAHTVLILHYLAKFHALPIALRLKKPKVFYEKIRPHFNKFDMNENMDPSMKDMLSTETIADVKLVAKDNEKDIKRVDELFELYNACNAGLEADDGPYTSITHMDLWINNLMVKYDETGVPAKLKFIDFQITQYESVVHDIIFLLLSSVDTKVVEENYHHLLRIYYNEFINTLNRMNVCTKAYSFESFMAEVQRVAHLQIPHALFMVKVVLADNSTLPSEFKDMDMSVLSKNRGKETILNKVADIMHLAKKFNFFY